MLKILGTGFGRTGTTSLKIALEMLGFGPCYHMVEVFAHPEHIAIWTGLAEGTRNDFAAALAGYPATVDWPSTHFWRQLLAANPAAKVIHTERPPQEWFASMSQTILATLSQPLPDDPMYRTHRLMTRKLIREQTFGDDLSEENVLRVYEAHNQAVRDTVPAGQLLVFNARDGWAPLCAFLDVAVPDAPYPRTNDSAEFRARAHLDQK